MKAIRLLTYIPLAAPAAGIEPSGFAKAIQEGIAISISHFLQADKVHSTLLEFSELVTAILSNDDLSPRQRATAIEDQIVHILVEWAKAYLSALILSATPIDQDDLRTILRPFEKSVEVTLLLSVGSQFSLNSPDMTLERVRKGWMDPAGESSPRHDVMWD